MELHQQALQAYGKNDITASVRYGKKYGIREVALNPDYVVAIYPHDLSKQTEDELLPDDLDERHEFSRVLLSSNSLSSNQLIVIESLDRLLVRMAKGQA